VRLAGGHQVNPNDVALDLAERWQQDGWGPYEPAIRRWEQHVRRTAPFPAGPGSRGRYRLSPDFAEWLMGLPATWLAAVPGLPYAAKIRALGNGVVPRQAAAALRLLTGVAAAPGAPRPAGLTCRGELSLDAGGPGRKASQARALAMRVRPAPTAAAWAPRPRAGPGAEPAAANAGAPGNDRRAA
jgi:hypothetical protein